MRNALHLGQPQPELALLGKELRDGDEASRANERLVDATDRGGGAWRCRSGRGGARVRTMAVVPVSVPPATAAVMMPAVVAVAVVPVFASVPPVRRARPRT